METVEEKLYWAARYGRVEEAQYVLEGSPGLNVNWADAKDSHTALHIASLDGYLAFGPPGY